MSDPYKVILAASMLLCQLATYGLNLYFYKMNSTCGSLIPKVIFIEIITSVVGLCILRHDKTKTPDLGISSTLIL